MKKIICLSIIFLFVNYDGLIAEVSGGDEMKKELKGKELAGNASVIPVSLRCEYIVNPLGIDVANPRLSWVLEQVDRNKRNLRQTAFQIIVASSPEVLLSGKTDMWDSDKVTSDRMAQIVYEGRPLKSAARYWWKVRVWDGEGKISSWSEPAWWETGLLNQDDWQAKWVGAGIQENLESIPVSLGDWIWHPSEKGENKNVFFFRELDVKQPVSYALIVLSVDNEYEFYVNGDFIGQGRDWKMVNTYRLHNIKQGKNLISVKAFNREGPAGFICGIKLFYRDGKTEEILSSEDWLCSGKSIKGSDWISPDLTRGNWVQAESIAKYGDAPWGRLKPRRDRTYPSVLLRRNFSLKGKIRKARAYVCGLGYYELYLNDKKVGDNVLDPGQTNYEHFAFYITYDVTEYLRDGNNTAGIMLGNGWYNQELVWGGLSYGRPATICRLQIDYEDGKSQTILTDEAWKTAEGPVIFNNVYAGEIYDARKEIPGWAGPGLDDSEWQSAWAVEPLTPGLKAQTIPPIKRMKILKPVALTNPKPDVWIYDMGQNFAGWVRLTLRATAGTTITLRFSEVLAPDGTIDPASTGVRATGVVQIDRYICKGVGTEVWEPRFTYHGFRYVEMTGFSDKPALDMIEGVVVHTSVETVGNFECSNELINRIHSTALWTEVSNLHSIPTDCPHRERCGWLGDAHVSAEMTIYNFDVAQFWTKFMLDIETSLGQGGGTSTGKPATPGIPCNISTGKRLCGQARPDWGSAIIQIPWYMYLYYQDKDVFTHHYPHMKRWVEYLTGEAKDSIVSDGYGDWCPPGTNKYMQCPPALSSTALYYFDVKLMSEIAEILGKNEDAVQFKKLASEIKQSFIKHFLNGENMTYGCQTADAIALYLDLIPEGKTDEIAGSLFSDVMEKNKGHFTTGIIGVRHLFWALSNWGNDSAAYTILTQKTYPSYAFMFSLGATTLWEAIAKKEADGRYPSFSHNHPMQGGFDAWFYHGIGGINPVPEAPGFRRIVMKPHLVNQLEWARANYCSISGLIESDWKNEGNIFHWRITIPPNTTAVVYVPVEDAKRVTENSKPADKSEGVKFLRTENGFSVYEVTSGRYHFTSPRP